MLRRRSRALRRVDQQRRVIHTGTLRCPNNGLAPAIAHQILQSIGPRKWAMSGFAALVLQSSAHSCWSWPLILPQQWRMIAIAAAGGLVMLAIGAGTSAYVGAILRHHKRLFEHRQLLCPACEYPLDAIAVEGRCPECGNAYTHAEVVRYWEAVAESSIDETPNPYGESEMTNR